MTNTVDSGLSCLVLLLRFHGVAAEPEQIRHRLGVQKVGVTEMLRCAKELGLKARASKTSWARLARTPLPVIAMLRDGGFVLLGRAAEDKVLLHDPLAPKPEVVGRADFETVWEGRIFLMARRAPLSDLS